VQTASESFPSLRAQQAPEVGWDSVRARVHWSVSTERRAMVNARAPRTGWVVAGAFAAGGIALALATDPIGMHAPAREAPIARTSPAPDVPAPPPAALGGLVNRMAGQVMIDGVRRGADAFEQPLAVGSVIATGEGRIDVQFGDRSALSLGPGSTLSLRRFDAEHVELVVEGTIDIDVAPRAPGQRFVVVAGDRAVEVRGTQFRVSHDATGTKVACRHGKVVVGSTGPTGAMTRGGDVEVGAGKKLELAPQAVPDPARVAALSASELDELALASPATTPLWTGAEALAKSSAALEITTAGKRAVRVDGVELGDAPLHVRVMPGRHTVETADPAGRFRRSGWVDVAPGKPARLEVHAEVAKSGGSAARRAQLRAGIDRPRLAQCTRAMAKQGLLADSYVHIEISIDETGAVQFLNVIDTDLPSATAGCVRAVLADVRFEPGPAATFRDKLGL
jgi:hypothetical protein